jgi:ABC-type antimicrobial peptide transport system permease subunit
VVIGIAVIIGFLVIFQSMYTSVLERTREIGILKSMGASKWTIVSVVLRETAVLAVAGVVVGVALSFAVKSFSGAEVSLALSGHECGLGRPGRGDCLCRLGLRLALSGLDGRPQRPHRRAGLRVEFLSFERARLQPCRQTV